MAGAPSSATDPQALSAKRPRRRRRRVFRVMLAVLLLAWAGTAVWHSYKPMPEGTRIASAWAEVPLSQVRFLVDSTITDGRGRRVIRQEIFDEVLRIIDNAQHVLVLDFFLVNDWRGSLAQDTVLHRALSSELRAHLLARKRAQPGLQVLFVSDPINDLYGGQPSQDFLELRAAGIDVVVTDLDRLRDSNPLYSGLWRLLAKWWAGDGGGAGALPNPLESGPDKVSLRSWLRLLNFKSNHRKIVVADDGKGGWISLVTSANPHDASSSHSNIAVAFHGELARVLLDSEVAVARFSGWKGELTAPSGTASSPAAGATARIQVLTEGAIKDALLTAINTTQKGEWISIAVFYLSDRDVLDALVAASRRDVRVRVILDPNKDAFGRSKDGVPNRPVAAELLRRTGGRIEVRWYRTRGEQFHVKLALVQRTDAVWALLGSANFTRRNLDDHNLEADVAVESDRGSPLAQQFVSYFEMLWQNDPVALREYTTDFPTYEDQSFTHYWRYRLMEATGVSTF
jgi:phosphatidylserine/phosphatidylglycerophosphate/cardiolipin synthase-like enzyme